MNFAAAAALMLLTPAAQQPAPASREEAQRTISAAFQDATFTVFRSNPPATGWYQGRPSDPCRTRYSVVIPPHTADGTAMPARTYDFAIWWHEVLRAEPEPGNPDSIKVTRRSATEFFKLSGSRQAAFLAAANYLIRACAPSGAAATPAAGQPTAASPPAAQPAAASPVAVVTSNGTRQPVQLGRELQVTRALVAEHDAEEFFGSYYTILMLKGRTGDRFTISWRATDPISPDYGSEAFDLDFPDGQKITDPAGSVTVTFTEDGEHEFALKQVGVTFSKPYDPIAGFRDRSPRAFLPFHVTVRKPN